jgi:hypothetical protein
MQEALDAAQEVLLSTERLTIITMLPSIHADQPPACA